MIDEKENYTKILSLYRNLEENYQKAQNEILTLKSDLTKSTEEKELIKTSYEEEKEKNINQTTNLMIELEKQRKLSKVLKNDSQKLLHLHNNHS